ncbi:serine/threonine-protein kinase bud32 [Yamadazyma tenuis]|uniref:EKC/KEOPS complex subunit BUD32 n=1 Tax=Candida tenuis (strain ATCC 10573 / BCRC 21748 / CBS 615 / JCM 9827 / NBRC 10315 / NRRL Y-1498 / VKM Y-70) TaxID=590646 RepID=G3AWC4_CANTC|nr:kinase-like protein [Yamadazyma tenuis ATCC 10573]XP_006684043.1 uncharacterized protein CANTEDRAFT_112227 [Yamadazyma tenuis ATCC 10573]EGV66784.1 kinase-like protein [Yamadazyma tenuis ATCC 10573]EGV66785.1 hypothetical protein CANTEDRAFT_112227 [Yamadazyma tenuis ATCC 10573]WEJ95378.1 serine/threonine-protein kinase bud32 [Yamadazyma tenuis]
MTDRVVQLVEDILPGIPLQVVSQGAEAVVFRTGVHPYTAHPSLTNPNQFIIKYRPSKKYRHPKIDASITKSRTAGEVKFMHRLAKAGINAPNVVSADFKRGLIWMEHLGEVLPSGEVSSFKNHLWSVERTRSPDECVSEDIQRICEQVGQLIGQLHHNDMIHGDLTSSNIVLQKKVPYLIDFGLSSYSGLAEDKAVDLYVLERAIQSTHSMYAYKYNQWLLKGYEAAYGTNKQNRRKYVEVMGKLEDVRQRGRKRSMLG